MRAHTNERVGGPVALVAALALVHLGAVLQALDAPERLRVVHDVAGWAGSVVGVLGTLAAARAFAPGDWLRRVWGAFAAGALLLLLGTALRSWWTHLAPGESFLASPLLPWRMGVVVAANVVSVWALVSLVLTWHRAGLRPPGSWTAYGLWALSAAAALAIAVPQGLVDVRRLAAGGAELLSGLTSLSSTLGDTATILLVAPLLRVAYLMRGGRLSWPWWAMAASGAVWLVYDGKEWMAGLLPGSADVNLELLRVLRTPGLALVGLAGWLQRAALAPQAAPAPTPSLEAPPSAG